MTVKNEARRKGFFIRGIRSFFEHRALWMYFLCDEARKSGANPGEFAPRAIRRCGSYHGMRALTGLQDAAAHREQRTGGSCKLLKKRLFSPVGRAVFEMKILQVSDDVFNVDFYYCPLVAAWKKQNCSGKEMDTMCDWAMEGDRGIAESFGCELELPKTIARGDGICQIRFKRKGRP
ncbi:MAG: L-2-amino-thiazoline-4-carboxylic acid hydrolase [Spirochaetaceae bacterium]|jgi:hypothetical protein|nr:L-2-amino-thiazoline-4-carboxylic acid hydrolase [Spirochaetaceae bacterium]